MTHSISSILLDYLMTLEIILHHLKELKHKEIQNEDDFVEVENDANEFELVEAE
jgi:hypothetical protein